MAKSARASSRKAAKRRIGSSVHAPVEEARLNRLSAKLLAVAAASSSSRPISTSGAMDVEHEDPSSPTANNTMNADDEDDLHTVQDMDVDDTKSTKKSTTISSSSTHAANGRKRKSKSSRTVVFPGLGKKSKSAGGRVSKASKSSKRGK